MKHFFNFIVLVTVCTTLGCGGTKPIKTDYVEGKVTYKGAPVANASINFSPAAEGQGNSATGQTDDLGNYKLQTFLGAPGRGTTPGEYIVTINKMESVPSGKFTTDTDGNRHEVVEETRSLVPNVYTSRTTSPLRATVVGGGPNKFDFDLVDKP